MWRKRSITYSSGHSFRNYFDFPFPRTRASSTNDDARIVAMRRLVPMISTGLNQRQRPSPAIEYHRRSEFPQIPLTSMLGILADGSTNPQNGNETP
jgi:hypothetical protein